jgi:hypothetical protein
LGIRKLIADQRRGPMAMSAGPAANQATVARNARLALRQARAKATVERAKVAKVQVAGKAKAKAKAKAVARKARAKAFMLSTRVGRRTPPGETRAGTTALGMKELDKASSGAERNKVTSAWRS